MIDKFMGEYRWLSNFHPINIYFEGLWYPTTEHAYQAAKTFDQIARYAISKLHTPGGAKRYGSDPDQTSLRYDWDESTRIATMRKILVSKFNDPWLAEKLMETAPEELVEGNSWGDTFWGVCKGEGRNELGKLLMSIRTDLIDKQDDF